MGSLIGRIERLEERVRPGVDRQYLFFPTQQDADRYLAAPERLREGDVVRRVYIGITWDEI